MPNGDILVNHFSGTEKDGNRCSGNIGVIDGKRGEVNRANARLIAASPDMYEALKAALWRLEKLGSEDNGPCESTILVRKAIAKAEGRV